jgi:hypothetical protein
LKFSNLGKVQIVEEVAAVCIGSCGNFGGKEETAQRVWVLSGVLTATGADVD